MNIDLSNLKELNDLKSGLAISPLDGRYLNKVSDISNYFSEFALVRNRLEVEVEYFIFFNERILNHTDKTNDIREILTNFNYNDFLTIKKIEKTTNHDVKAVEYFLRQNLEDIHVPIFNLNFVHFGLTSHDINSPAMILQLKGAVQNVLVPLLEDISNRMHTKISDWLNIYMLSRTHGQPATPTNLAKEILVFKERLDTQLTSLQQYQWHAKMGGAVGNLNAHYLSYPKKDWEQFFSNLLHSRFGLRRLEYTTQIGSFDSYAELFHIFVRINSILIDFNRDIWSYISFGYFNLKTAEGEIGSSTMPHKINPILFENSEGNLLLANSMLQFFASQYPLSRMQRDLVNSTLWRNNGVAIGHCLLGWKNFLNGFNKLDPNIAKIESDLNENWCILSEPIQIILKQYGMLNAYEIVKEQFRTNVKTTKEDYLNFVNTLQLPDIAKNILLNLTPSVYAMKCCNFQSVLINEK